MRALWTTISEYESVKIVSNSTIPDSDGNKIRKSEDTVTQPVSSEGVEPGTCN